MRRSVVLLFAFALCVAAWAKVRVACVGDSITYGLGLADREHESYPAQLQNILDEKFPGKYEVRNFGNSGRGIYLDSMRGSEKRGFRWMAEHKAALEWKPDVVICNLGINDNGEYIKEFTGGRKRGQFRNDYLALLEKKFGKDPLPPTVEKAFPRLLEGGHIDFPVKTNREMQKVREVMARELSRR